MKNRYIKLIFGLFTFIIVGNIQAQDNRTIDTKVADILAQFPTKNYKHSDELSQKIIDLGEAGFTHFVKLLVPQGKGNDTKVRYALESLAVFAGRPGSEENSNFVEKSLLKAIEGSSNNEVKLFLIRRLNYCASDVSLPVLGNLISTETVTSGAIGVITSVGSSLAGGTLLKHINNSNPKIQQQVVQAIGTIKYRGSLPEVTNLVASSNIVVKNTALYALAKIAAPESKEILYKAAKMSHFKVDEGNATVSYLEYAKNLGLNGQKELSKTVCKEIIENTKFNEQLHIRSAAYSVLSDNFGNSITPLLIKEAKKTSDKKYLKSLLNYATNEMTTKNLYSWIKTFKKLSDDNKGVLLSTLAKRKESKVFSKVILPSLESKNVVLRIEAIKALAIHKKGDALPFLINTLKTATSKEELKAIKEAFLRTMDAKSSDRLVAEFSNLSEDSKVIAIQLLGAKRATQHFNLVFKLASGTDKKLQEAAYNSILNVSTAKNTNQLIQLLNSAVDDVNIQTLQSALSSVIASDFSGKSKGLLIEAFKSGNSQVKLLPVFPVLNSKEGLDIIKAELTSTNPENKKAAINALLLWKSEDVLPYLYEFINKRNEDVDKVFVAYLDKVKVSLAPDDQKLLLIRKLVPHAKSTFQISQLIKSSGTVKTFLSLVFVSEYIETKEVSSDAMNAVISIILPSPGESIKFKGDFVKTLTNKVIQNLSGPDSQYIKIDLKEFLEKMPKGKGYVSIFNGKDLSGWEGLIKNPIARAKMSKKELKKAQKTANDQMLKEWFVKDGVIGFKGEGYNNICTIKDYGDFEMIVDWKITNGGDSGIYLRGTPQVQIWDIARVNVGAQVGSGGLYNNKMNERIPLTVADNPINDWNTFRIKMVGERVTVYLNGVLVTNNVTLENYWERTLPIFTREAIELQAHGEDLGFRNIYVREIVSGDNLLNKKEKEAGFKSLFNGRDLDQWIGNKKDYFVENNEIMVMPKQGGHGNLYTAEEYSDFNFRFEFKLTPGANNGLGIHAPLKGDAAYLGKEIQILDNTAAIYKNLKPYQYHGSVYGIIASKRGYLKPVGEWNSEEVIVKGNQIKVILNGVVIVDGNMKEASKNGTADHKNHPGLNRTKGHIGFLGHGSELQFRNVRIKDLKE